MYACICHAVSEREIKELISNGANSIPEIRNACGAGSDCGSCLKRLQKIVQSHSPSSATGEQIDSKMGRD